MPTPNREYPALTPHKAYAQHWAAIIAAAVTGELLLPATRVWMWLCLLLYFIIVEGAALKRSGLRDTMTEFWGWFLDGGPDRKGIVVGFALWAPLRLLSLPAMWEGPLTGFLRWAPPVCLFGGFCVWLVPHLLKMGRDG